VNPQFHEEFIALGTLFFSGELSQEEWALLQVHLAYCDSCREHFEQLQSIHRDLIPEMAAAAATEREEDTASDRFSLDAAEERLMQELDRMPAPERKPIKLLPLRCRQRRWSLRRSQLLRNRPWNSHRPARRKSSRSSSRQ
jgi:anti-sigma factor RsiW